MIWMLILSLILAIVGHLIQKTNFILGEIMFWVSMTLFVVYLISMV